MRCYILVFSGFFIFVSLFFYSCNRGSGGKVLEKSDSLGVESNVNKVKRKNYYKIPLSIDLLNYIKEHNKNYNPELLNLYSTGNGPADSHRIIFVMTPFTTVSFERNDVAPFVSNKAELC
jgi:hypothetical protein